MIVDKIIAQYFPQRFIDWYFDKRFTKYLTELTTEELLSKLKTNGYVLIKETSTETHMIKTFMRDGAKITLEIEL